MFTEESAQVSPTFNFKDYDIVIRSRDEVFFMVHKLILKHASEVWNTMLSLPRGNNMTSNGPLDDGVQVVELAEDADAIHTLLCYIYPVVKPAKVTFDTYIACLGIAVKYEIPAAVQLLSQALITHGFTEEYPLRAYAVACRHGLEEMRELAYRHLLTFNFNDTAAIQAPELANLTALDYHNLCHKKLARSKEALLIFNAAGLKTYTPYLRGCGGRCWFASYARLVSDRLGDNATSSAVFLHDEEIVQVEVMTEACSQCRGAGRFLQIFCNMQKSAPFKEVVRKIDSLP